MKRYRRELHYSLPVWVALLLLLQVSGSFAQSSFVIKKPVEKVLLVRYMLDTFREGYITPQQLGRVEAFRAVCQRSNGKDSDLFMTSYGIAYFSFGKYFITYLNSDSGLSPLILNYFHNAQSGDVIPIVNISIKGQPLQSATWHVIDSTDALLDCATMDIGIDGFTGNSISLINLLRSRSVTAKFINGKPANTDSIYYNLETWHKPAITGGASTIHTFSKDAGTLTPDIRNAFKMLVPGDKIVLKDVSIHFGNQRYTRCCSKTITIK